MHQFQLGPKAIQEIQRFQLTLNRFTRKERLSIVRYLSQSLTAGGYVDRKATVRGVVVAAKTTRATRTTTTADAGASRRRKLSKVARARVRGPGGTFAPIKKTATRARARAA